MPAGIGGALLALALTAGAFWYWSDSAIDSRLERRCKESAASALFSLRNPITKECRAWGEWKVKKELED